MKYSKTVTLKNGKTCIVRNGTEQDAEGVLANFMATHGQTEFLTTYPDETPITLDEEKEYLTRKEESERDVALVAEVEGIIAGAAGVDGFRIADKTKHRAHFGISIDQAWWGIAGKMGYLQLELEVVADNVRAVSLYKSAGFTEYGRNPKGFRTRDGRWQENILMRLELDGTEQ